MPHSPSLWMAAALLWMLDASINVSMEPFRAFVGDQLPPSQRPTGYAMQSFFIGVGAVVASLLPWLLAQVRCQQSRRCRRRDSRYGALRVLPRRASCCSLAIGWTVLRTREYPPEQLNAFDDANARAIRPSHG